MALEVVHGQTRREVEARQLVEELMPLQLDGTLYLGYPVLASADDKVEVDALLVCPAKGLFAIRLAGRAPGTDEVDAWKSLVVDQDRLFAAVEVNLGRHETLRVKRRLAVQINVATLFPTTPDVPDGVEGDFFGITDVASVLETGSSISAEYMRHLQAALQRVTTIKPQKKRDKVASPNSRGAALKTIERNIANLDQWQKRAAIESPNAPQRIRGLAGSGKTIVLALKAAYLHAQYPEWTIAVTYYSRALSQQFTDLIRRFSYEHTNSEPDWNRIRVLHSWGGADRDGVYTEIAKALGSPRRDFMYGRQLHGMADAFRGVCAELLAIAKTHPSPPLYDAVLIDEAQDLPPAFLQLVYRFTHEPKRIVWAYDEFQRLSETEMPSTADLFGVDERSEPLVRLHNTEGQPKQDIILPVCYRNPPWTLTLAHALGMGLYRQPGGLVQHFDEPQVWTEVGYRVVDGDLESGKQVTIERDPNASPSYFSDLIQPNDAIVDVTFTDKEEQFKWVAQQVKKNLREDELEHDDILIIFPDAISSRRQFPRLQDALQKCGVAAHLAGVTSSRDELFSKESIAVANIYRSKGNEAPMVYILDADHCVSGHELLTLRNILFTSITRSRAWVRICGCGKEMTALHREISKVRESSYQLRFRVPTAEELKQMRMLHRERTADERARIKRSEKGLREFLELVRRGEMNLHTLPPDLRTGLAKLRDEQVEDENIE